MHSFLKHSGDKHFSEHHGYPNGTDFSEILLGKSVDSLLFKNRDNCFCVGIRRADERIYLSTNYYVGVDWLVDNDTAIYVEPKLNNAQRQTNYLEMLFAALRHPEVVAHTDDLFEIKWNVTPIEIEQHQDLLTPLLVILYLRLVKEIVRKGLKNSYYKVEHNLYGRVKGKVIVGKTIKQNALKNKPLNTWCSYDEFGLNSFENRLLKKAMIFIQSYLPTMKNLNVDKYASDVFNYINPAFESISEDVSLHDILHTNKNPFYKEYSEAIRLAKLILQRFGYNITNTSKQKITVPPFWIDMSKLFELYVLGLLKERFGGEVHYHFKTNGNELDYLINQPNGLKVVVDAKYKPIYQNDGSWDIDNIRQVSGYARLKKVYEELGTDENSTIDCLIIYPQALQTDFNLTNEIDRFKKVDLKYYELPAFSHFYTVFVHLPVIT